MLLSTQWLLFGSQFCCVGTSFQAPIPSLDSAGAGKPRVAFGDLEFVFPSQRNSSGAARPELLKLLRAGTSSCLSTPKVLLRIERGWIQIIMA